MTYSTKKGSFSMKKCFISLLALTLILLSCGCEKVLYVLSVPEQPTEYFDHQIPSEKTFEIEGKTIALTYKYSQKNGVFHHDCYFANTDKRYHFDENGNLTFIRDNEIFPAIENIETLSKEQIKEAVIARLSDTFDFSAYDTFTFQNDTVCYLRWSVSGKDISLSVTIDQMGRIAVINQTHRCPEETPIRISEKTRDSLLKSAIQKEVKGDFTFKILSETQTYSPSGKNAMSYAVSVTDGKGFSRGVFLFYIE